MSSNKYHVLYWRIFSMSSIRTCIFIFQVSAHQTQQIKQANIIIELLWGCRQRVALLWSSGQHSYFLSIFYVLTSPPTASTRLASPAYCVHTPHFLTARVDLQQKISKNDKYGSIPPLQTHQKKTNNNNTYDALCTSMWISTEMIIFNGYIESCMFLSIYILFSGEDLLHARPRGFSLTLIFHPLQLMLNKVKGSLCPSCTAFLFPPIVPPFPQLPPALFPRSPPSTAPRVTPAEWKPILALVCAQLSGAVHWLRSCCENNPKITFATATQISPIDRFQMTHVC